MLKSYEFFGDIVASSDPEHKPLECLVIDDPGRFITFLEIQRL